MNHIEALRLFAEANELWFQQGFTIQALARYQAAGKSDPTDPVVHYQLARALWAFSRFEEARAALVHAQAHSERLSPRGKELLTQEIDRLSHPLPFRSPSPVTEAELDVEHLQQKELSPSQWLDIAYAAREREMFGLAAYAFGHSSGSFRVHDLEEEEREMRGLAASALNRLYVMRTEADRKRVQAISSRFEQAQVEKAQADTSAPSGQRTASLMPGPSRQVVRPQTQLAPSPLAVEIEISPARSSIETSVSLSVALINRSNRPLAVNQRLLLNQPSVPPEYGEIYLSVEGPPGYENLVAYHVRAGPPGPEHFDVLAPGESVSKSYALSKYESLHLPGSYTLWVTYRNTVRASVKGLPLFVGSIASEAVLFERHDA